VPLFMEMSGTTGGSVLDAGCGSGKGALALAARGFRVVMCDVTDAGVMPAATALPFVRASLWNDLVTAIGMEIEQTATYDTPQVDYVYCCDVLEHVPTEFTMLVLSRLLDVARHGVFLSIALVPDGFGVWVGETLHQTVRDFCWWRDRLRDLGELVECRDLINTGVYFVRAR
jgi:SAM-dependent methyltransferase